MAVDKLINHEQGEDIIEALGDISQKLEDLKAITPADFGLGYAVCDTAAATAAKTATLANYVLTEGAPVSVKFTYANTASNATLNLNSTGAKPIYYKGSAIGNDVISAGDICTFIYSTNVYNIVNIDTLTGAGTGTVTQVGAEGGIITDQTNNADITRTGNVKLNLKSDTAFATEVAAQTVATDNMYPVALDSEGHPVAAVPTASTTGKGVVGIKTSVGAASSASETDVPTEKAVADAIAALPEPMVWSGSMTLTADATDPTKCSLTVSTSGTIGKGYTYKVTSIATTTPAYAGTIKVGDTFYADKKNPKLTADWVLNTDWTVVPSGDEPSGTVTGVKMTSAGTAIDPDGNGIVTLPPMGASGSSTHAPGLVPDPGSTAGTKKYLCENATWATPTGDDVVLTGYQKGSSTDAVAATDKVNAAIAKHENRIDTNQTNISYVSGKTGKNLFEFTVNGLKQRWDNGTWNGNTFTSNFGVTIVVNDNKSIVITGTPSTETSLTLGIYDHTKYKGYVYSGGTSDVSTTTCISGVNYIGYDYGDGVTMTGDTDRAIQIAFFTGTELNITFKPMICTADDWAVGHDFAPYALPNSDLTVLEAEDRAALAEEIDAGAKNLCTNSSITSHIVGNFSDVSWFSQSIPAGTYILRATVTSAQPSQMVLVNANNTALATLKPIVSSGTNVDYISEPFTLAEAAKGFKIYSNANPTTWTDIMITTKAAWDVSQKFVPYCKSNYDLTSLTSGLLATSYNTVTPVGNYISGIEGGYIKIGNLVVINIRCTVDNATPATWTVLLAGLPYTLVQYGQGVSGAPLSNNKGADMAITGSGTIASATSISTGTLLISGVYMSK